MTLLQNKDGVFRSLVDQTGSSGSKKLFEIAQKAHDDRVANGYDFPHLKENVNDAHSNDAGNDTPLKLSEIAAGKVRENV